MDEESLYWSRACEPCTGPVSNERTVAVILIRGSLSGFPYEGKLAEVAQQDITMPTMSGFPYEGKLAAVG